MKNKAFFLFLIAAVLGFQTPQCQTLPNFAKVYGDNNANIPTKVKAFNGFVYLAGQSVATSFTPHISKFDPSTGAVMWQLELPFAARIQDFEWLTPSEMGNSFGGLILVGHYEPLSATNGSFIVQITDNGTFASIAPLHNRAFDLNGRESLTRIIRHPSPANLTYPFYVLGVRNQIGGSFGNDQTILMNVDKTGTPRWLQTYQYTGTDDEMARVLQPGPNGGTVVFGGSDNVRNGMLVLVDGNTGNVSRAHRYLNPAGDEAVLNDGVTLPDGRMVIVGQRFNTNEAFAMLIDVNFQVNNTVVMPDLDRFIEAGLSATVASGTLVYTLGRVKSGPLTDQQVVYQINVGSGTFNAWYLNQSGDSNRSNARFHVSKPHVNNVIYAEARVNTGDPATLSGSINQFVGAFDLTMTAPCRNAFPTNVVPITLDRATVGVTNMLETVVSVPAANWSSSALISVNGCVAAPMPCMVEINPQPLQHGCYKLDLTGIVITGTAPFTYSWDIDCDGIFEVTGASSPNYTHMFTGPGSYPVCLNVTDATGCMATATLLVTIFPESIPPTIMCPSSLTLNTDPGLCCATGVPPATAFDSCGTPTITYQLLGVTPGSSIATCFNKGVTTVVATATDASGNTATCSYTVTVRDVEPPVVVCPSDITANVSICTGFYTAIYSAPTLTDNCPMPTYVYSQPSGSQFPCGITTVTATATDMSGNTSTCAFTVNVNCTCATIASTRMECTSDPNVFTYQVVINNLTGGFCDAIFVDPGITGITFSGFSYSASSTVGEATGTITITPGTCIPQFFGNFIRMDCICPGGTTVSCPLNFVMATPCCHTVSVANDEVCATDATATVPLVDCSALPDVQQVTWYVAYGPTCPPVGSPAWGVPYQVNPVGSCADLLLTPASLTGDVCVYAVVTLGPCGGGCTTITSNVATIRLCESFACSITSTISDYECSKTMPTTATLSATFPLGSCTVTGIKWFDYAGNLLVGGPTLSLTGLSYANAPITSADGCWKEYLFFMIFSHPCGIDTCEKRIRIYDNDAPAGTLTLLAPDVIKLCPGEDAQLLYDPACATPEPPAIMPEWTWHISTDGSTYTAMPSTGTMNPLMVTNRLYADTWYKVTKENGVCPADEVDIFLDYHDAMTIGTLSTTALDPCWETGVRFRFMILSGCGGTVRFYRDGYLIHAIAGVPVSSLVNWVYLDPSGNHSGHYWVEVEDACCGTKLMTEVDIVPPPCSVIVAGPCCLCGSATATLTAAITNPPAGGPCTYQWSVWNPSTSSFDILPGETGLILVTGTPGTYQFEVNCGGWTKTVVFTLLRLGIIDVDEPPLVITSLGIAPNPSTGQCNLSLNQPLGAPGDVQILDFMGHCTQECVWPQGTQILPIDLSTLPSGGYFVQLRVSGGLQVAKVVKE